MKKSLIISMAVASLLLAGCGAAPAQKEEVTKVAVQVEEVKISQDEMNEGFLDAAKKGDVAKINEYAEMGADINSVDKKGNTAVILALSKKKVKMDALKAILALNPDLTIANEAKEEAIAIAKDAATVKMLLDAGVDKDVVLANKQPLVVYAAQKAPAEVVKVIAEAGANLEVVGTKGNTALIWAVLDNKADTVNALLGAGANLETKDSKGNTALMWASESAMVNLLLDAGANVNAANEEGLVVGQEGVMFAIEDGNAELVKKFIDKGVNVNFVDAYGDTPLILATQKMNNEIVKLLISLGADTKKADKSGKMPIDYAGSNAELLEILK